MGRTWEQPVSFRSRTCHCTQRREGAKKILDYLKPLRGTKLSGLAAWRERKVYETRKRLVLRRHLQHQWGDIAFEDDLYDYALLETYQPIEK